MRRIVLLIVSACLLLVGCGEEERPLAETTIPDYEVGQIWNYLTRPGEETSSLLITRVQEGLVDGEQQIIIHVYIDKLDIPHPEGGTVTELRDVAFTKQALDNSLISPFDFAAELPDTQNAYEAWYEAYQNGGEVVFDIPVASAIQNIAFGITLE